MPQIAQYEAPQGLGLRPSETGVQATAAAARRLQGDYSEAAAAMEATGRRLAGAGAEAGATAVKAVDHYEMLSGGPAYAGVMANASTKWDEMLKGADVKDPTTAQKYLAEYLEPALEEFRSAFTTEHGQKWAEERSQSLRIHMADKTRKDMEARGRVAVDVGIEQTSNNLASAAYRDSTNLEMSLKSLDSAVDAMIRTNPNLTGVSATQISKDIFKDKVKIIKAAISGMVERNPNVDLDDLQKKYGEYITGQEMKEFSNSAKRIAKSGALQEKQAQIAQRQLDERNVHILANKNMADNVSIDPATNRVIIKPEFFRDALNIPKKYPDAPNAATVAKTHLDWGEKQQDRKETIKSNPGVKQDLVDRMFDTDNPTTELDLMRAQMKEDLSKDDFATLRHTVKLLEESPLKGPIWKDTMDAVKANLIVAIPGLPGKDTRGVGNYAKFAQLFIPQYLAAVRAGNVPANALDVNDPKSMISQAMAPFTRTQAERLRDYVAIARGLKLYGEDDTPADTPLPNATPPTPKKNEIPPATRREVNKVYQTDVGPRKWTGTGWVQP